MKRFTWGALALVACACSSSPVVTGSPWSIVGAATSGALDKVDLVLAVDDSPGMGDKEAALAKALPTLVGRLLNPNCIDQSTQKSVPGDNKGCSTIPNTTPELPPVHDMHIAIVSSSLGGGGSPDECTTTAEDDHGHALNRPHVANAQPLDATGGNFLAWLPQSDPANAGKTPPNVTPYSDGQSAQLVTDFQSLVIGAGEEGCFLEAQLESWYRFLIQPDPYMSIAMSTNVPPTATFTGVDATLIAMRHDFLRPDSLVAILQLTDEEDSWSDPLWSGGFGWTSRTMNFPGGPGGGVGPRGTSECDQPVDINNPTSTGPNNPDCMSCAFPGSQKPVSHQNVGSDPNCNACAGSVSCQNGWYTAQQDGLNVRYGSQYMRARYGFDNQFDVQRYVDGLQKPTVSDRDHEARAGTDYSTAVRNCTNPLFATNLPDGTDTSPGALCNLQMGSRTPDRVFYGLIGGVPHQLVEDVNGNFKPSLSADDWKHIVGTDPQHYIFDAIDPHMIESTSPRAGLPIPIGNYSLGTDPYDGREWNTSTSPSGIDLEYACTFDLPSPKDCTQTQNAAGCDCVGTEATANDGPPLCDATTRTMQIKGKAYPSIRELRVAQGLGVQALTASICTSDHTATMNAFVDLLKPAMSTSCLRTPLPTTNGVAACAMIVVTSAPNACTDAGLSPATASMTDALTSGKVAFSSACVLQELTSCTGSDVGWCYETNTDGCTQKLAFSPTWSQPQGTQLVLMCTGTTTN